MLQINRARLGVIGLLGLTLTIITVPVSASDAGLIKESSSYRVYLGIVPARLLKKTPTLLDKDKSLHGGLDSQLSDSQHVMVAIYRKSDNQKVLSATVTAEIRPDKLFDWTKIKKPLEKMQTSGTVTYGNFFLFDGKGEYEIDVTIYETNADRPEDVSFEFEIP